MAYLDMLEGFHCGKQVPLPDAAVLGRHPESFLCLPDTRVSRQHARILRRGMTFVIEDSAVFEWRYRAGYATRAAAPHHPPRWR